MTEDKKTYTLGEVTRKGLVTRVDGEPYKVKNSISKIAKDLGIEKTGMHYNGKKTYEFTEDDIEKMNEYVKNRRGN